ncbi:MAG: hypothetical protein HKN06_10755, partial [Gammaproteobacteria bacterium]|nr:hypothetical protein [Gammaproteobacteria bacterium]
MDVVCTYCGVAHPQPQSFCNGCGGALPAARQRTEAPSQRLPGRRKLIAAALGLTTLVVIGSVIANRLSGPQQVEIVNLPGATPVTPMADVTASGAEQHRYITTARFAAAYTTVHQLRMFLTQYRMEQGNYPQDFSDLRIDPDELSDGEHVTAVTLQPGGVLVAHLEPTHFGDDAVFRLTPRDVMAGTRTRWDCTTTIPDKDRLGGPGHIPCKFSAELV